MMKLLMLKGLPASGKSTLAKELVEMGWKRVNKDDLRLLVDNGKWSEKNERMIVDLEHVMIKQLLSQGFRVVVDDTNFHALHEKELAKIAKEYGADFEVKFFDVPVEECIERDSKRGDKMVGKNVIMKMYNKYLKPEPPKAPEYDPQKQDCYIFDIDGTLAKMTGRSPYDYTKVSTDIENKPIADICRKLDTSTVRIIIVSGRVSDCKEETRQWLSDNNIPHDILYMRESGDMRNDAIVKREIYLEKIQPSHNVLAVFDDRNRVVDMWRSFGLTCLQVNYGDF